MRHLGSKLVFSHGRGFADRTICRRAGQSFVSLLAMIAVATQVQAQEAQRFFINGLDFQRGTFRVDNDNLDNGALPTDDFGIVRDKLWSANPENSKEFDYIAVYFKSDVDGNFLFGQNLASQDTAMLLYSDVFNTSDLRVNFVGGIDDANTGLYPAGLSPSCAGNPGLCPQISHTVSPGSSVSLVITPIDGSPLDPDMSFYTNAAGRFATNPSAFLTTDIGGIKDRRSASNLLGPDFFNGGTVVVTGNITADLGVWKTGGTFDTTRGTGLAAAGGTAGSSDVIGEMSGKLYDYNGETGRVYVTGGNVLRLSGENTHTSNQ